MPSSLADYDEDLNQNPFFRTFVQNYLDLFSQCVLERWLICVPRRDSLPQHGRFTIEDFTHHILKPLNHVQELNYIGSNGNEEIDRDGRNGNWPPFDYGSVIGTATDGDGPSLLGAGIAEAAESIASIAGSSSSRSHDSLNGADVDAFSCDTSTRQSGSSRNARARTPCRQYRKWNFETLSGCKIAYDYNTLFLDDDPRPDVFMADPEDFQSPSIPDQLQSRSHPRIMRVLFEETFYTTDKQKYKVLCVASPLNARVEEALYGTGTRRTTTAEMDEVADGQLLSSQQCFEEAQAPATDPSDWTLCSLRDCIDFIWLNGRRGALETYDGFVKLFLHNHKALDDLPLRVQRDLIADVYQKCISAALKPDRKKKLKNVDDLLKADSNNAGAPAMSDGLRSAQSVSRLSGEDIEDGTPSEAGLDIPSLIAIAQAEDAAALDAQKHERFAANFKLATETYILNSLYRPLIHALSSGLSAEDANLNKILRNLADIQPKDLHINEAYWEGLGRAKLELSRIANLGSPLAKLDALKRTINQLKLDPKLNSSLDNEPRTLTPTSADEMLPMWVYLVIKTPIGNWMAQLEFLKEFRFSAFDPPGSENTFLVATLEAAVTHLYADRANSYYYMEFGGGTLVEDRENAGSDEDGGGGGRRTHGHVSWLPANFLLDEEDESTNPPALSEMFRLIRAGNVAGLEAYVSTYELERHRELKQLSQGVDESKLCHPLCVCDKCTKVLHPEAETGLTKSAFQLETETGVSLLHMACICGRPKIVEFLLVSGASAEVKDNLERTPLHYAAIRGHQNALLLLCHWGCTLEALDHMQSTPLHYAALNGHDSCVKALIYYGEHSRQPMNISAQNCNGDTPLHFASRNGYQAIVQILVENGASITLVNARQLSAADCALNVHVTRILQRSLRRRSLCNVANYGDFVSIEVMKKEISPGQDRVLMLISDPSDKAEQEEETTTEKESETSLTSAALPLSGSITPTPTTKRNFSDSLGRRSRKTSYNMFTSSQSMSFDSVPVFEGRLLDRSRRHTLTVPLPLPLGFRSNQNTGKSVHNDHDQENGGFQVLNPSPEPTFEPEHLKTVAVDNLENTPVEIAAAAVSAPGVKRKRREIGVRKLFTAIAVGDVPLALFYLGIPTDELQNAETIRPGDERYALAPCHPLCACARCVARGAGLGLDMDTKNLEGLSPLHLAVMYNLNDLVRILCKYGADIGLRSTFEHNTAAEIAYDRRFHEIEETLCAWKTYYDGRQQQQQGN